jgi:hypothetical protein
MINRYLNKNNRKENKVFDMITYCAIIAWGIIIVIVITRSNESFLKSRERYCYRVMRSCYQGKIIKIWYGNGGEYYDLETKITFNPRCQEYFENSVMVGDSIYKPKGTWSFYIYKQANPDSVILIKCDFDCSIYREGE